MTLDEQLIDTWQINNRINIYLLDAIDPNGLRGIPVGMKGRSVGEIFAHIHNVRLVWLAVSAPDLMAEVTKVPVKTKADKEAITKDLLRGALEASGAAMTGLFQEGVTTGKIKNFKPHVAGCFGYFIAHEGYHRGEICMTLTQAGHKLPDGILYKLWDWDKF
jgi:uncharacterized damage-inducible protein DinB